MTLFQAFFAMEVIANASYGKLEKQKQLKACGQKQGQGQSEGCALFSRQTSGRTVFLGHIQPRNLALQSKSVLANRKWALFGFICPSIALYELMR